MIHEILSAHGAGSMLRWSFKGCPAISVPVGFEQVSGLTLRQCKRQRLVGMIPCRRGRGDAG